jgi:hypothetical protein
MPSPMELLSAWREREVIDNSGKEVGRAESFYRDDRTGEAAFLLVHSGLFGHRMRFVPLDGATIEDDTIRVAYDKETIEAAPGISADEHLSEAEEQQLFRHYGVGDHPGDVAVLVMLVE